MTYLKVNSMAFCNPKDTPGIAQIRQFFRRNDFTIF